MSSLPDPHKVIDLTPVIYKCGAELAHLCGRFFRTLQTPLAYGHATQALAINIGYMCLHVHVAGTKHSASHEQKTNADRCGGEPVCACALPKMLVYQHHQSYINSTTTTRLHATENIPPPHKSTPPVTIHKTHCCKTPPPYINTLAVHYT